MSGPSTTDFDPVELLQQADELERGGDVDGAVSKLRFAMGRGHRRAIADCYAGLEGETRCPVSYPIAAERHREAAAKYALRTHGATGGCSARLMGWFCGLVAAGVLILGALCLVGAVAALVVPLVSGGGTEAWLGGGGAAIALGLTGLSVLAMGLFFLAVSAVFLTLGKRRRAKASKAADLLLRGIDHHAELIRIEPGQTAIGTPRYRLILRIRLPGQAAHDSVFHTHLPASEAEALQRGDMLPVVVDPDDPTIFVLDR